MAKAKTKPEAEPEVFANDFLDFEAPEFAIEISGDIVGYWDYTKSAIRCIPRSVKMFDGNIDKSKVSSLIMAELTREIPVLTKNEQDEMVHIKAPIGQMVGIWYKPGMRGIVNKCGVEVYIKRDPKKDKITNKKMKDPYPMKGFLVMAAAGGTKIPIIEDTREHSAEMAKNGKVVPVLTVFHDRSPGAQRVPQPRSNQGLNEPETDEEDGLYDEEEEDEDLT